VSDQPGLVFDRVAEDYDRVRPGYPDSLVDAACSLGALGRGSSVVEVGCGTGKLTAALAERGLQVDAVDPGPALIEVSRRRVGPNVRFHLGRFEDVELPDGSFDAVFSATAFHWVEPAVGWAKVARLLRPGGLLALLTHLPGTSEIDADWLGAWREVLPDANRWELRDPELVWQGAEERRGNVSEVWAWLTHHDLGQAEAADLFQDVRIAAVPIEDEQTAEEALALVRTTSSYLGLDDERRRVFEQRIEAAVERVGGRFRSAFSAVLVTALARR
jgi:ubiquinone/menaquinone biosynthesis C-methylase UbiE